MNYKIITAADDHYFNTLVNFIENYINQFDGKYLIVYDLGFNKENYIKIYEMKIKYNFLFKKFNYDLYPEHVDLKKYNGLFSSYAFKPIILYNEANDLENTNNILIWMDSANRFNIESINNICNSVINYGLYTPLANEEKTIESIELNHPETVKYFGLSDYEHKNSLRNICGNLIGFNYKSKSGNEIIDKWYFSSLETNVIMPEGSSRNNHRQDQTILSILIYLFEKKNNIFFEKNNFNVSFWNKFDNSTVQNGYFPFRLFDKNNNIQLATIYCKNYDEAIDIYSNRKLISKEIFLNKYKVL
jgi:hypothetical protein